MSDPDDTAHGGKRGMQHRTFDATAANNSALALVELGKLEGIVRANHDEFKRHIEDDRKGFAELRTAFQQADTDRAIMRGDLEKNSAKTSEIYDAIKPLRTFQTWGGKLKTAFWAILVASVAQYIGQTIRERVNAQSAPAPAAQTQPAKP